MTTTRTDLLALTEDALAALANRGLVKRAAKELVAGAGASIFVADDGTIEATFPDGVVTRLTSDSALADASCTCAATAQCRHRVGLVLAYQAANLMESADTDWSPGDISDETLTRVLGARAVETARKALADGCEAIVHRGLSAAPRVELPACTVTFHVQGDPAYATTDATEAKRGEAVVLAVWAFRGAHGEGDRLDGVRVHLGGDADAAEAADSDFGILDRAAEVVEGMLLDGTAHAGPLSLAHLQHAIRELGEASMVWPAAVAEDLADQIDWYTRRSARYEMRRAAELAAEFQSRRRAARGSSAAAQILGTAEPRTTELRRVRLVGLGCRIEAGGGTHRAELYFAHPQDGTVLVLRRSWETEEEANAEQLRTHRIAKFPLHQLAVANLVSEAATRSAARVIALGSSNVAKTSVLPVGRSWLDLPDRLLIRDFKSVVERLGARGPRFLRPRVAAEDVFVFVVDGVETIGYDPAQQRLEAVVRDEHGTQALVRAEYGAHAPAALGALAHALTESAAPLISASVVIEAGLPVLRPIAVSPAADGALVVPDLESGDGSGALPVPLVVRAGDGHPITAVLDQATDTLAEHAHRGLGLLIQTTRSEVDRLTRDLRRVGLLTLSALFAEYARTLAAEDGAARVRAWTDAAIAVDACRDARV